MDEGVPAPAIPVELALMPMADVSQFDNLLEGDAYQRGIVDVVPQELAQ